METTPRKTQHERLNKNPTLVDYPMSLGNTQSNKKYTFIYIYINQMPNTNTDRIGTHESPNNNPKLVEYPRRLGNARSHKYINAYSHN